MEKLFLTLVLFWFSVCSFAEDYSFSVIKSGIGKKSVIFIPGFASSGDVWKEAVAELGTDRKSTRLNSSHSGQSRMPSSA